MSFAAPIALALGLLAVPLILLYLLRPRREEVRVPSTFLWREALQEVQANAPWQRLRRNLLLLLQLLILALLVLALARPLVRAGGAPGGDLVVLLDSSGSMAATDVSPTRFEAAKERASTLARELVNGRRIAVITVGPYPRLIAGPTEDRQSALRAIEVVRAPHGESNLADAAILARAVAGRMSEPTVIMVGDGGGGKNAADVPALPHPVRFESVRGDGENAAVLSAAVRSGAAGRQLWVSLANWGGARTARLTLEVDGALFDARQVALPVNGTTGVEVANLPPGRVVEARLDAADALAADNVAWYVDDRSEPTSVLLYGEPSVYLQKALSLLPGVEAFQADPGAQPEPGYDLYILNGALPKALPAGNLLLLGAPNSELLPVIGQVENVAVASQRDDSLLLRYVNLSTVSVATAQRLQPPDWMQVLAGAGDAPMLVAGEQDGRRVAALAFVPEQSDLPLQTAFPILMDNLIAYLGPGGGASVAPSVQPGEPVLLPETGSQTATVVAPDGRRSQVAAALGAAAYADTAQPGVYTIVSADGAESGFAVNAGSRYESQITAASEAPIVSSATATGGSAAAGGRERWQLLVAMGVAVLLLEWWLYNQTTARRRLGTRRAL